MNASKILDRLVSLGLTNRGIKDGRNLAMVRGTSCPSMLIECMFIDSNSDMSKYNAENIAKAIVEGFTGKLVLESSSTNSGKYSIGWHQEVDGKWWYADSENTYCKDEWKNIDGSWYYFDYAG